MPPYAGLDELHHVARLAFVAAEHRNPTNREPSVPPYLERSLADAPGSLPDFAALGARWPERVRSGEAVIADRALTPADLAPYLGANYEAQQPSAYYSLVAPLVDPLRERSALGELRVWRLASVAFGVLTVLGAGWIGYRHFGFAGILAAALLPSLPTWLTLVARASNDAICCAAIAAGLALTLSRPERPGGYGLEAAAWSLAVATKLYSWPLLVLLPLAWRFQKASRARIVAVSGALAAAGLLTVRDLASRTSNALGLFAFDPAAPAAATGSGIDYLEMAKIWVATALWTSGQHWNALTGSAMLLYGLPLLALAAAGARALWLRQRQTAWLVAAVLVAFALAQVVNAAAFLVKAQRAGESLPAGGKEGWYWYALAPLLLLPLAAALAPGPGRGGRGGRALLPLLAVLWIAAWDLRITEGALFRDYAGRTDPSHRSFLFRWGEPADLPPLPETAVGPLAAHRRELRAVHLAALAALLALTLRAAKPGAAVKSV